MELFAKDDVSVITSVTEDSVTNRSSAMPSQESLALEKALPEDVYSARNPKSALQAYRLANPKVFPLRYGETASSSTKRLPKIAEKPVRTVSTTTGMGSSTRQIPTVQPSATPNKTALVTQALQGPKASGLVLQASKTATPPQASGLEIVALNASHPKRYAMAKTTIATAKSMRLASAKAVTPKLAAST